MPSRGRGSSSNISASVTRSAWRSPGRRRCSIRRTPEFGREHGARATSPPAYARRLHNRGTGHPAYASDAHSPDRLSRATSVNILVCVKRVPATGGTIVLTPDAQDIDTRYLGFTVSPHEECAVEEAVRLIEANGGSSTVMTLGPAAAEEQLRDAMAIGIERGVLLETDGRDWDPVATATALAAAIRDQQAAGQPFDLLLFGNEAADTGDYQVAIRVATALGLP